MVQVGYFKWTRRRFGEGKRFFKMAPLHNHFELLGWSETQVMQRFVLVGVIAAMIGISLALTLRDEQRAAPATPDDDGSTNARPVASRGRRVTCGGALSLPRNS